MQTTYSTKPHDRHNGPYALRRSVNFVFLLLARQNKQVSFALAYASVPAHATDDGSLGIGQVMCKRVSGSLLTIATSEAITRLRQQPWWLVLQKDKDAQRSCAIAVDLAGALSK